MTTAQLNLARKWRSKQFDQIIGQDIAVGILKNSLFLGKIFPVYLFSGQHGCGKTTTARVFAAAANCEQLPNFQKNPQQIVVPCGTCMSCTTLAAGRHPDFIEMDAASNTGVDNVRTIIEAASLMPQLGRKKIYLIDEAHMLSKAAFNAFLKILEEPPAHVFFILATTDEHKVIDTVKSRCFQLIFNAVEPTILHAHLQQICEQEQISYQAPALDLIIKETRGSVRDALNLVEQVALSKQEVSTAHVLELLGHIPEEHVQELCKKILHAESPRQVLEYVQQINLAHFNAEHVWKRLLHYVHAILWIKHDVVPTDFAGDLGIIKEMVHAVPTEILRVLFQELCTQEPVFLRTLNKPLFVQYTLMQLWYHAHEQSQSPAIEHQQKPNHHIPPIANKHPFTPPARPTPSTAAAPKQPTQTPAETAGPSTPSAPEPWQRFLQAVDAIQEPLLASLLKQAHFQSYENDVITVAFTQRLTLFHDTINTLQNKWLPVLQQQFGPQAKLEPKFNLPDQPTTKPITGTNTAPHATPANITQNAPARAPRLDVSDKNQWPLTHKLLADFPGTVSECSDS